MRNTLIALLLGTGLAVTAVDLQQKTLPLEAIAPKEPKTVQILIETSLGNIKAELFEDKAPMTVSNILQYVDKKFYDETVFHRVINGFMIQGGGFTKEMVQKDTDKPIKNEADNGLKNSRGTLAMARTGIVDSATSQFFINLQDRNQDHLDHKGKTDTGWGYCVFGKVLEGMDTVDKIAQTPTGSAGRFQDVPTTPVVIKRIRRFEPSDAPAEK